eukprot:scaffold167741_cov34-Tisochrysis_lutea.AAC.7
MPLEGIRATSRVTLVIVGPADILPLWIGWEGHELHALLLSKDHLAARMGSYPPHVASTSTAA